MQRFCVTPVLDSGGRQYFVANYPAERKPWSRKAAGRKQKKFSKRESAESFLEEVRREWLRRGKVELGLDPALHYDVMRAARILSDTPNGTLEKSALIFRRCVSARELRGTGYEAPKERRIELSPRFFLLVDNEAKARNVSTREAAEGLLSEVALCRADQAIRQQTHTEETEYRELKRRNDMERQKLREIAREAKIWEEYSNLNMMFEQGRQSVLGQRAAYQRRWRQRKKEREVREKEVTTGAYGSGNGDLH